MITQEQLYRICVEPEMPEINLGKLPDTYQWAGVLRGGRKYMAVAAKVMGLEFSPGAIFTGPEGNGRHTTAYALAQTLCADRDGYSRILSIHGDDLDFEERDDIYTVVEYVTKEAKEATALVLIVDQPGLSRHNSLLQRLLLRVQSALLRAKLKLYLILITDKAEDVCPETMSRFPRYHCAPPDQAAVKKWAKKIMREPVPINIADTKDSDLAAAVQGLSWKQLKDLHHHLLRLTVLQYAMRKKSYDAKGITEEQVYREGKVKLDRGIIHMILDSTAGQKYATAPVGGYIGGPVMQMMPTAACNAPSVNINTEPVNEEDIEPIDISDFTNIINNLHSFIDEDPGN